MKQLNEYDKSKHNLDILLKIKEKMDAARPALKAALATLLDDLSKKNKK